MKTKTFVIGTLFGLLIAVTLATRSQDKKVVIKKDSIAMVKRDSAIAAAPLPDSTKNLIKEVDSLKRTYDTQVLGKGKEKLKVEARLVAELKNQNNSLMKLTKVSIDVDTLPRPILKGPNLPEPDSVKVVERTRKGFFDRIFNWRHK